MPGVAAAVFPNEPERTVYNNAILGRNITPPERRSALAALEDVYAEAGVTRFAVWVHESDQGMCAELARSAIRSTRRRARWAWCSPTLACRARNSNSRRWRGRSTCARSDCRLVYSTKPIKARLWDLQRHDPGARPATRFGNRADIAPAARRKGPWMPNGKHSVNRDRRVRVPAGRNPRSRPDPRIRPTRSRAVVAHPHDPVARWCPCRPQTCPGDRGVLPGRDVIK